jgi:broad specificity phosphatase PhoE
LTPQGAAAAEKLGRSLGEFNFVVASTYRRTTNTVEAMGLKVSATETRWASLWDGFDSEYPSLHTLGDFQAAIREKTVAK